MMYCLWGIFRPIRGARREHWKSVLTLGGRGAPGGGKELLGTKSPRFTRKQAIRKQLRLHRKVYPDERMPYGTRDDHVVCQPRFESEIGLES